MATSFSWRMNWELLLLFKLLLHSSELYLKLCCFTGWFLTELCLNMLPNHHVKTATLTNCTKLDLKKIHCLHFSKTSIFKSFICITPNNRLHEKIGTIALDWLKLSKFKKIFVKQECNRKYLNQEIILWQVTKVLVKSIYWSKLFLNCNLFTLK